MATFNDANFSNNSHKCHKSCEAEEVKCRFGQICSMRMFGIYCLLDDCHKQTVASFKKMTRIYFYYISPFRKLLFFPTYRTNTSTFEPRPSNKVCECMYIDISLRAEKLFVML